MENTDIARTLATVADLLEIQGANPFRIRAYRNAVHTIQDETSALAARVEKGEKLTDLPGIGKDISGQIVEMVTTGKSSLLAELGAEIPLSIIEITRIPGLGPKKAKKLWQELGVTSATELEVAVRAGRLETVEGFGEKSAQKILEALESRARVTARMPLGQVERAIEPLLEYLKEAPGIDRLEVAGSYRRRKETIGDVDLLAVAKDAAAVAVIEHFARYRGFERIEAKGDTKCTAILASGLQVDLRVVPRNSFGAALVYFTGSKEHNIALRKLAVAKGLRMNEWGVFKSPRKRGKEVSEGAEAPDAAEASEPRDPWEGEWLAGREEKDVYATVGLRSVPPELREDRGEIEAFAGTERLPRLIEIENMRGDLQMHSTWSDGATPLETMLEACAARGYEYFAITDHSQALAMVRGLSPERLKQQWKEIAKLERKHSEIRLLKSMEVDILADGTLDLPDELLFELDLVLVSIHSRFDLPAAEQTARILRAIRHPAVHILAHPTGRRLGKRESMRFDVDAVLREAASLGVAVEQNANPGRLDLNDVHLMRARELGCKIVISTDAHAPAELDFMHYGIEQARRAWLEAGDVLNTYPLAKFLRALRPRPRG
ncbi:MAG: helix-hairpin-helix domain-containing protein [Acidobacteriota bacterium]